MVDDYKVNILSYFWLQNFLRIPDIMVSQGYTTFYIQDSKRRKLRLVQQRSEELLEDDAHNFNFDAPYHKLDRQLFETMLKYLSKEDDEKILNSVYR